VLNEPADHNWNGLLDDVAIFAGALDESRLAAVMSGDFSAFQNTTPHLFTARSGSMVVITWDTGTLQSKSDLAGQWQDVPNAQSPLSLVPTGAQQFYRVNQ
jgi:hypothetical protein